MDRRPHPLPTVVCCPDKFRGSLSAAEAAAALAEGARRAGATAVELPLADGGEGTLAVLCPHSHERRQTRVRGPLGEQVEAEWGLRDDGTAVVEMARASGLALLGEARDVLAASTSGTGQLIRAAIAAGADRVIVGVGGSATVDGGLGAIEALDGDLRGTPVLVACDVQTTFVEAARLFGPQKGADEADILVLEDRLRALAERYRREHHVDVASLPGAGAAGGLAGGLAALGATLVPGAALVAEAAGLDEALAHADAALTGEGKLDRTSLEGKVVAHVIEHAHRVGIPVGAVAGAIEQGLLGKDVPTAALLELAPDPETAFGDAAALATTAAESVVARLLGP